MFTKLLPRPLPRLARTALVAALCLSLLVPVISGLLTALAAWLTLLAQIATCLFIVAAGLLGGALLLALASRCARRETAPGRSDAGAAPGP